MRYADAFPGIDLVFASTGFGLKETAILASPSAASSYASDLRVSKGTAVETSDGQITLSNGTDTMVIPSPWATDAGGEQTGTNGIVSTKAEQTPSGWTLTTSVDSGWLQDPVASSPVEVDPTFTSSGTSNKECHVDNHSPSAEFCTAYSGDVGDKGGANFDIKRLLLKPDLSSLPLDATVVDATVTLKETQVYGTGNPAISAIPLTRDFNADHVTWNNAVNSTPTSAWTTAGGDLGTAETSVTVVKGIGQTGTWHIPKMVQGWIADPRTAYGFAMKADDETADRFLSFGSSDNPTSSNRPSFTITWTPRVGSQRFEKFWNEKLSDHSDFGVNLATGNLMVHGADVSERGAGLGLTVDRYYNSRSDYAGSTGTSGWSAHRLGSGWTLSTGNDVWIDPMASANAYLFHGPTGMEVVFRADPVISNTWTAVGQNARLTYVTGSPNQYKLAFNETGLTYTFFDTVLATKAPAC